MSTTHITFERNNLEYTLTGDRDDPKILKPSGLSILLLNRGGKPFREDLLHHLSQLGTKEILSVETSKHRINTERWQKDMPHLRMLFFQSPASWGEMVNIGIKEASGEYVFVFWNDMDINGSSISSRVFTKIEERQDFCTLPWLYDKKEELFPSRYVPCYGEKQRLEMLPLLPDKDHCLSLFPFDFTGIYHRDKFLKSGGFDGNIKNSYWQWMDLGFRAAMCGNKLIFNSALKVHYSEDPPEIHITADEDYVHYHLKTLALQVRGGKTRLPRKGFWELWRRSNLSFRESSQRFRRIQEWVSNRKYSFKKDAHTVVEHWEDS